MPDWSYQTVVRPVLFWLPPAQARDIALGVMGQLVRIPGGPRVIELMGHMRPDPRLKRERDGFTLRTPVGLGLGVDLHGFGSAALARLGFGFVEIGPVGVSSVTASVLRDEPTQSIGFSPPTAVIQLDAVLNRLSEPAFPDVPVIVRIAAGGEEWDHDVRHAREIVARLSPRVATFALDAATVAIYEAWPQDRWEAYLSELHSTSPSARFFPAIAASADGDAARRICQAANQIGMSGAIVTGVREPDLVRLGRPTREQALEQTAAIREQLGEEFLLITSGGIHEPADALELMRAGANLVLVDSGLVFSGPGLPKRINEAVLAANCERAEPTARAAAHEPATRQTWFWTMLIALSMLGGGLLAWVIAATRVVMPYDEFMVDMTRDQIAGVNDHLLHFLTHDRVTLAGTMLSIGVIYFALSWFAIRKGVHWARQAVLGSAFSGFFSFFLFLGFGYFDPLHAFVTAVLFQFLLFTLYAHLPLRMDTDQPDLYNDWRWKCSQWGQLIFVIHGAAIIMAGVVICYVGITKVFVPEDLLFMQTTADQLHAVPRLVPLIAHDRATFGGMLISCGVAVLLCTLWGFRRGASWLWWTLETAGSVAYLSTIWVHHFVGYTHLGHLAPAYGGFLGLLLGGALTYPYMCSGSRESRSASPLPDGGQRPEPQSFRATELQS